jgi:hypothetical protein
VYDNSKDLVGIVFYSKQISSASGNTKYDVRVLSASYSSTNYPLGPANYALYYSNGHYLKNYQSAYNSLLSGLNINVSDYL